jgi:hypothetical protein
MYLAGHSVAELNLAGDVHEPIALPGSLDDEPEVRVRCGRSQGEYDERDKNQNITGN